jgi:hypothetical protein
MTTYFRAHILGSDGITEDFTSHRLYEVVTFAHEYCKQHGSEHFVTIEKYEQDAHGNHWVSAKISY